MYFKALTLNIMTLGGLTLGAGMLVDNAIIVMENIYRHLERGASVMKAAVNGTAEVGGAITASTLTTIVVFLPIVYMQGASGQLFKDQAWTVAFSLLSSLVVAILVIPVLVSKIFPRQKAGTNYKSIGFAWYPVLLAKILNKRYWVIGGTVAIVVGSYMLLPFIGSEFMPQSKSDSFTIEITLPEGTSLTRTSETIQQIEEMIESGLPEYISTIYSEIGTTSNSSIASLLTYENKADVFIRLTEKGYHSYDEVVSILDNMLEKNDNIAFSFLQDETSLQSLIGNNEAPIVVEVIGEDIDQIMELTEQAKAVVAQNSALFNVASSVENGAPEISVVIDRVRAGLWGVTVDEIVTQLQNNLQSLDAGEFDQLGEMISINIKQPNVSISKLENIEIKSSTNAYRLSDLASIEFNTMPKEILRRNQTRIGKITAYMNDSKPFDHVVQELNSKLSSISLPANYKIKVSGEEEKRAESMANLTFALLLSIVLVYMVMASQFESLIHPFTILLTIPMALVGTILTFALIGSPFNIMAYIGMIMLVGIAVNDSIILVDAINQLKAAGVNKRDAILQAGQQRIRPIIMTSLTTVLALIPLTIGFGESASLRSPMAWAVIGGLVTSTLLTLVVIPCVYWVFDRSKPQGILNHQEK
jgi:HAE1 family hydrophobic/amphiphilic exporter-1